MIDRLWAWFGVAPERYWWVAMPLGIVLVTAVFLPRRVPGWLFLLILALTLGAFRWPAIVHGLELNRDESQMIAAAITLKTTPVYWRDVDAHAVGPLDVYPLTILGVLGMPLNYLTARAFGLFAGWLSLLGLHRLLREAHGETLARAAVVVGAGFFCLLRQYDLVGYSSEVVPACLVSLGMAALWIGARRGAAWLVFLGALAMGAVPWAKIQATPAALAFGVGTMIFLWRRWAPEPGRRRQLLLWGGAGCGSVTLVFSAVLTLHGLWSEWATDYIRAGVDYTGSAAHPLLETVAFFASVAPLGYYAFFLPLLAVIMLLLGSVLFHGGEGRALALTLGGAAGAAVIAVTVPGRIFPHYLLLTVTPLAGFAASLLGTFLKNPTVAGRLAEKPWRVPAVLGLFLLVALLPEIHWAFRTDYPQYVFKPGLQTMQLSRTAAIVRQVAAPGDRLGMWGWEPSQFVQTGLPQATHEAHSERLIANNRLQLYYRARYLADIMRASPRFFIDAVGPGRFTFSERPSQSHESWPELAAWVAANYRLVDDTEGVRLYIALAQFPKR